MRGPSPATLRNPAHRPAFGFIARRNTSPCPHAVRGGRRRRSARTLGACDERPIRAAGARIHTGRRLRTCTREDAALWVIKYGDGDPGPRNRPLPPSRSQLRGPHGASRGRGSPWATLGCVSCGSGVTVGRLSPDRDRRGGGGLRGADAARHRDGTLTAAGRERSADSCSSDRRLEGSSGWLTPRSNAMMAGGQQLLCESTGRKLFARGIEHRL